MRALIGCGIWENEYVKEDGIWKIKTILWNEIISSPLDEGWVKKPVILNPLHKESRPLAPNSRFPALSVRLYFPVPLQKPGNREVNVTQKVSEAELKTPPKLLLTPGLSIDL